MFLAYAEDPQYKSKATYKSPWICCYLFPCCRLIVLDPLLCDALRKKGTPPDERLTWQVANQR